MAESPKLPFKNYTALPNSLIQSEVFSAADVYRIFVLSLTADKITGITDTTIKQLAGFVGESESNYENKNSFTDKLRASQDVEVRTISIPGTIITSPIKRNQYKFRLPVEPEPFRMIHREFYDVELDHKIKGYLIRLFSVAHTNTMFIGYSQRQLEKLLHMSAHTIRSYNKILVERGLIVELKNGLLLTCPGIIPIEKRTKATKEILASYNELLTKSILLYNESHTDQISIDSLSVEDIKKLNLDRSVSTYAYYFKDDFSKVKNINSLALFVTTGVAYKSKLEEDSDSSFIVL